MLNFAQPPSDRKRKRGDRDDDAGIADDEKEVSRAARMTFNRHDYKCLVNIFTYLFNFFN